MDKQNLKIIAAALAGLAGGLALGMFIWSPEKEESRKKILSKIDELKDGLRQAKAGGDICLDTLKDSVNKLVAEVGDKFDSKVSDTTKN